MPFSVELTHPFILRCLNIEEIMTDCFKLNTFLNNIEKQALKSPDADKYKGDALELFTETLIKLSPIDKRLGIRDYKVVTTGDTGVDGHGIGFNDNPATVQVKWRIATHILTANEDHLSNFVMTSFLKFGVPVTDKENMLIVTTAKDIHHYTNDEMFCRQVRTVSRDHLRDMVDNNTPFWKLFRELWIEAKENMIK
jgi:hypothetical protein